VRAIATELGVAYLSLSASTGDFAKDVKSALKDAEIEAGDSGQRSGSRLGRGLSNGLKVVGGAVAGVTALVAGMAIKGGIDRALAIEGAQAKLTGLGHDVQSVQTIMDSALASVRGTAFGLGDAASVAASVVAAGVQPGEDLTRTLKLVADASTIAGTSMGDMGAIFNKVASTGKIQGEVIAQLGERGIPILQLLGEQMGVSAAEVSKLASEGKVDFATFQAAMEAGMGGAALESGNTFRGAMANAMAALGRLGEKVVGGVLPQLKGGFGEAIALLDSWAPQAERVGVVIGGVMTEVLGGVRALIAAFAAGGSDVTSAGFAGAMERIGLAARFAFDFITGTAVPAIASLVGWMNKNRGVVAAAVAVMGALLLVTQAHAAVLAVQAAGGIIGFIKGLQMVQAVAKVATAVQWAWNAALTANPIGLIIAAIAALVAGIIWFFTQTELGQKIFQTAWAGIQAAISAVVAWVTGTAVPWFQGAWDAIMGAVQKAVTYIQTVIAVYAYLWRTAIETFLGWITGAWDAFWGSSFGQMVKAAIDLVVSLVQFGVTFLRELIADIAGWISATWSAAWDAVSARVQAAWALISGVVQTALIAIGTVVLDAMARIRAGWDAAWGAVSAVVSAVWGLISGVISSQVARVRSILDAGFTVVRTIVSAAWQGVYNAIATPMQEAYDKVRSIVDSIRTFFSGAASWLVNAGRDIIQGLIEGITSKIKGVTDTLRGLTESIPDWKGPADVDRRLLTGNGELIMGSLVTGLKAGYGDVRRTLMGMTADLPTAVSLNTNLEPRGVLASNSGPLVQQTITPVPGMSETQVGDMAGRAVARAFAGVTR